MDSPASNGDILYVIADQDEPHGLSIKDELESASVTWPDNEFREGETVPIDIDGTIVRVLFDGDEITKL
ncbi:hypothetical protein [Natrinema longum]|uniref:Uncharacterized protein n=1 Tax=Natrinema longum TaxID=370324 RepID=A0A8A2U8Y8_9EURY|nr:hypothetical protein [Natrinema longum]MBZ6493508.1 hypothetical protein [Natrinema longum]QSW85144.1 hypothetical protein J0X27_17135 [Natrinema longum]